jgi:hypothetical protein
MKMKSTLTLATLLLSLSGLLLHAAPDMLTVAVFNFESTDESVRDLGPKISTLVNARLSAEPQLIMVERAEIEKLLGEHELNLSGNVSPENAVRVGQLTGAKILITGSVFKADTDLVVVGKIIGTETGRVYGEMVSGRAKAPIMDLSKELAQKIAAVVSQKGDTLVAHVKTREQRVEEIKKALKGKALPSVLVHIGEEHFGQRVIDPAAETELGKFLQDCGFKLVDAQSKDTPDVEITGDAFSAFGMRKGNLVSCRARVEIKARTHSGEVLSVDRQTSVGVDIAEQTAAKTALQNAAAELSERLLPKLVK